MNRFRAPMGFLTSRRLPSGRLLTDLGRDIVAAVLTIAAALIVASAYHATNPADATPAPVAEARLAPDA